MGDTADSNRPAGPRTPSWFWVVVIAVAIVPPALLIAWWTTAGPARLAQFASLLYWGMPVVIAFVGVCWFGHWRSLTSGLGERLRRWWPGIALAMAATVVVFWLVPPQMRVQFDETSLLGVSQNMHSQRQAVLTSGAIPFEGVPVPLENMVDKRPPLFAFFVSVVHDVLGYRVANAFLVNGALLALGLFLLFAAVRSRLGLLAGLTAPILVLSVPLTVVVATSAGFELLATVLLLATTLAGLAFVDRPDDRRCTVFLGVGMLLAHARYESIVACGLLALMAVLLVWRRYRPARYIWLLLALCPALVTPLFFLVQHAQDPNFTPEAGGRELVSMGHLVDHTGPFLVGWFALGLHTALPGLLAVGAAILWLVRAATRKLNCVDAFAIVPVAALTLLVLAWFYGDVAEPTALRLFLPLAWLTPLAWLSLFAIGGRYQRQVSVMMMVLAVSLCAVRIASVVDGRAFPQLPIAALTNELDRLIARLPGDRATTLWVGVPAQHLIILGYSAVSVRTFERLGQRVGQLQRQGDLKNIYVFETPLDAAMAPEFGSPRDLLSRIPSHVVERVGGKMPITVHQLGR